MGARLDDPAASGPTSCEDVRQARYQDSNMNLKQASPCEVQDMPRACNLMSGEQTHTCVTEKVGPTGRVAVWADLDAHEENETVGDAAQGKDKLQPGRPRVRSLDAIRRDASTGVAISLEEVMLLGGCVIDTG